MKPLRALFGLVLVLTLSSGCAIGTKVDTSPEGKAAATARAFVRRSAFNVAVRDVVIGRQAGKISDDVYPTIVAAAAATTPFLDEMDRAAVLGLTPDFQLAYLNAGVQIHDLILRAALGLPADAGSPPLLPPPEPSTQPTVDHPAILAAQRETARLMDLARSLL